MNSIGGQRSRIARANFSPSIEPGMSMSVKTMRMSFRASKSQLAGPMSKLSTLLEVEKKMSELGRVRDRSENTLVPDLLVWMGAAFGHAVERASVRPLRLGRAQMEDVIRSLPAAIYTTDAAGRITASVERTAGSPWYGGGGRAARRNPCPFHSPSNAPLRCLGHPHRCCEHAD
jgi:hypothetical protein